MNPAFSFVPRVAQLRVSPVACLVLTLFVAASDLPAWAPGTGDPDAVQGFVVDPANRTDVLAFFNTIYPGSENYAANIMWTGDVDTGVAGTTSAAFKDDVRRRINFYRALVALPADITFDATKSSKCQEAALMMARNNALSHTPPANWLSYTAAGAEAAGSSNLALGSFGPGSVDRYMRDDGANNAVVGHRRWLHYSRAQVMGTGDVPPDGGFAPANAIWVIGDFKPAPAPRFTAWPNRGFSPFPLMPARWSLSYPGAGFAAATVTMTQSGNNVPVTVISGSTTGVGDNTIVWTPAGLPAALAADTTYNITISGITGTGVPPSHSYSVTLFDPAVLGDAVTIAGPEAPPASGATYTFNSIAQADAYELRVATGSTAMWTEGAEDVPAPQIQQSTTGAYPLRQTAERRTGEYAFQLAFPDFNEQSFQITRDLVPSASSQLLFYDRGKFATETTTLSAEVSTDGGGTWTSVFSRNGVGLSSAFWDPAFISRSVSLAAFAGKVARVRFIMRYNGQSLSPGTTPDYGFFIDDVTVTNAAELVNATSTLLPGTATSFNLNATTAGGPFLAGASYFLRIRPNVGTRFFGFGPFKVVIPTVATGYAGWIAAQYPAVTGGPGADYDGDGWSNGMEYAFGLNPTVPDPGSAVPQFTRAGDIYTVTFLQPPGVTGVTYGAEWSANFVTWTPIPDSGGGNTHTFTVNVAGQRRAFVRQKITVTP
jgi:hypothetical protein